MPVGYLSIQQSFSIFRFTAVIKMEGGTDHDLRVLDVVTSSNDETKEKREGNASDDGVVADASIGK